MKNSKAGEIVERPLKPNHEDMEIMEALCHLTAKLRQEAMCFAHNKANYSKKLQF